MDEQGESKRGRLRIKQADRSQWNDIVSSLPNSHILQTWEWGESKEAYGWQPFHLTWSDENGVVVAAGLVLKRSIRIPDPGLRLCMLYVPRGPLLNWNDKSVTKRVLHDLSTFAKSQGAMFIKIDPEVRIGEGIPEKAASTEDDLGQDVCANLEKHGWQYSSEQIQFRNTVFIDLAGTEENLLKMMKQKTRYNIRLAGRKGVSVREGTERDISNLYQIFAETSVRDNFVIRDEAYYQTVWSKFMQSGKATPLVAEVDGDVVAGLFLFHFAKRAWYLYGMSKREHREKMPNYLLQWEAVRYAKSLGCVEYDLWGAPDHFDESDPMWGVFRFKSGLGGQVIRFIGAWDLPVKPLYYRAYHQVLPRVMELMRRQGRKRTLNDVID